MDHNKLVAAYHEAGHAVIATVLGLPVALCSISSDPPMCELREDVPEPRSDEEKDRFAMFYLAGITAQFHFHREGARSWHCDHDEEQIEPLGVEYRMAWLRDDTIDLVERNEASIKHVAQELLQMRELTGDEIQQIIDESKLSP